jgi:peptide/nickel transport system ATP-binding protein
LVLHRARSWREAERHAARLFGDLDLPSPERFGRLYPHQVSGGQLQRAMIAMAIACDPELLVFDEPTTALDVTTQIEVLAAIRETLRRTRAAAIYITHDLAVVAQLADRLMVLRSGCLIEEGVTADILRAPRHDYTRRLLAAENASPDLSRIIRGKAHAVEQRDAIAAEAITASYRGGGPVLRNVSIAVRPGETLALVGTSGSGKSTLARVLCGLLPPDRGSVLFRGELLPPTLRRRSREQLRRIQLVYQMPDTALNPRQRIGRILGRVVALFFGGPRRDVEARVAQLLGMVGLPADVAERTPSQLSGGQKQRVGIARALAARPDVIICDEVTSSLDPIVAEDIIKLLRTIQAETGTAYIFITHDIGVVRRIADRVAVLNAGEVVAQGALAEVFSPPLHPYTESLLSSVPQMRTDWLSETLDKRRAIATGAAPLTSGFTAEQSPSVATEVTGV